MRASALISNRADAADDRAFTLVEVVVAIGVLAVTVVAVLALQASLQRSAAEISGYDRAAQLADAVAIELARLRDRPVAIGQPSRLDALAEIIPASDSDSPLRLVAAREGLRVLRESEADDTVTGIVPRDRYYLIEVRQQPAPLNYARDAGYLAVALTVKWPYQIATGPDAGGATAADLAQASVVVFNAALTP